MSKIIIHNESDLSDALAVECVKRVIDMGFVSGEKQYCWASRFNTVLHNDVIVLARNTRGDTHSFSVRNDK